MRRPKTCNYRLLRSQWQGGSSALTMINCRERPPCRSARPDATHLISNLQFRGPRGQSPWSISSCARPGGHMGPPLQFRLPTPDDRRPLSPLTPHHLPPTTFILRLTPGIWRPLPPHPSLLTSDSSPLKTDERRLLPKTQIIFIATIKIFYFTAGIYTILQNNSVMNILWRFVEKH